MGAKVELDIESVRTPTPKSNSWFITIYFWLLGGISCCVYGSVTNSYSYFEAKFPNNEVTFMFPIGPYVANIILVAVITYLSTFLSYSTRMFISLTAMMTLQLLVPLEAQFFPGTTFGFWLMMGILVLVGFFSNMAYASICGFTSQLGSDFTTYFMIGVASFGLIQNLTRMGFLAALPANNNGAFMPTFSYFLFIFALILIALIYHILFIRTDFYKDQCIAIISRAGSVSDSETTLVESAAVRPQKNFKTLLAVFNSARLPIFLMFVSCLQLNVLYPGVVLLKAVPQLTDYWKNETMITTYGFFYIVGKKIGQYRHNYGIRTVVAVILFRFLLDAAIVLEVVTPDLPILNTLWFSYFIIALFATTMGFAIVALFIIIPEYFSLEKKEISGFVAVISNNLGSMFGGFMALPLANLS